MEYWNNGIMEWNGMEWNKKVLVHIHARAVSYLIFTRRRQTASGSGRRTSR